MNWCWCEYSRAYKWCQWNVWCFEKIERGRKIIESLYLISRKRDGWISIIERANSICICQLLGYLIIEQSNKYK